MGCLLQFFLFIFFIIFIGAVRLWWMVHSVMHKARNQQSQYDRQEQQQTRYSSQETNTNTTTSKKKVFADNEGEYVDFEEV